MKKPQLITEHTYHIYNRGVEKRNIFMDQKDYLRFIHDMYEFNDEAAVRPSNVRLARRRPRDADSSCLEIVSLNMMRRKRKPIVEVLAFCLMPNHFHLLLRQMKDGGITQFMHKLGVGYAMFFNLKYKRVGSLFQGRFKAKILEREPHFLYLPYYIHLNPLDLVMPSWREKKVKNMESAMRFLDTYRWSSHLDYAGKKNFPSVIASGFLREFLGDPREYRRSVKEWLVHLGLEEIGNLTFDDV